MDGLELLSRLRQSNPEAMVIMMTGYATVETAVEALKTGAYDYILKPFKVSELLQVVDRAFDKIRLSAENLQLKEQITLLKLSEAVSSSLSLNEVLSILVDAAKNEVDADAVELLFRPPGSTVFSRRLAVGNISDVGQVFSNPEMLEQRLRSGHSLQLRGEDLLSAVTVQARSKVGSSLSVPLMRGGAVLGMLNAYSRSDRRAFRPREEKALIVLGDRAATSLENALLYADLENSFRETIQSLALALEAKDSYTHGHSESVTRLCVAIATEMGCTDSLRDTLRQAGVLHDIGKIGISSNILNKPGKLTPEEYETIKSHPQMGKRRLEHISFLRDVVPIVYHHHERHDGMGYPEGLKGEEIPLGARVMAVADTYDAMTSDRPYRTGLGHEKAVSELRRCSGTQFDPDSVEAFIAMCAKNGVPCQKG
jgi:putative nucleotidyltransferase with HDIG domain